MPSVFSHVVAGLGIGALFYAPEVPNRVWAAGAICAALPDVDVIGFQFGIRYGDFWGHRGFTHSLVFAALLAGAVLLVFPHAMPGMGCGALWLYLFFAAASHGLLDAMTDGGLGIALLSPFDNSRYFFPFTPIRVAPIGVASFFTMRGLEVLAKRTGLGVAALSNTDRRRVAVSRDPSLCESSRTMKKVSRRYAHKWLLAVAALGALACAWPAQAQELAITVDDLPAHGNLPPGMTRVDVAKSIIKTLKEHRVPKVYGFVNAKKLEQHPEDVEVLRLWRKAGFPLGNHTYAHLSLNASNAEQFDENIAADEPTLESLMGRKDWHWFRYPYLWEGETLEKRHAVRQWLQEHKYHIAEVTVDFEDYLWNAPYARCTEKKDAGAIDWLKSTYMSTAEQYIALDRQMSNMVYGRDIRHVLLMHIGGFETVMLPWLLDYFQKQGFKFVTLLEAENDPAYKSDPDVALTDGGTLLEEMMAAKHLNVPANSKPYDQLNTVCK